MISRSGFIILFEFFLFQTYCFTYYAHNILKYTPNYEISDLSRLSYFNHSNNEIRQQHEVFLNNIQEFYQKNENFFQVIEWYFYGSMMIESPKLERLEVDGNITFAEALEFYGCDRLHLALKLESLGDLLYEMALYDEAVYAFEISHHLLLESLHHFVSAKIALFEKLGRLYLLLYHHDESIVIFNELTALLDESVHSYSQLKFSVSLDQIHNYLETEQYSAVKVEYENALDYIKANFDSPEEYVRRLALSAEAHITSRQFHLAELELRDCLNILNINSFNATQPYFTMSLNFVNVLFAQSKWWPGAIKLEKLLIDYSRISDTEDKKVYLRRLIKRTAGAYSLAARSLTTLQRFDEARQLHEKSIEVIKTWYDFLKTSNTTELLKVENTRDFVIQVNSSNTPKPQKRHTITDSKYGHMLDTIVFGTVVFILTSFGLYSFSGLT